jgi:hypothetical protein
MFIEIAAELVAIRVVSYLKATKSVELSLSLYLSHLFIKARYEMVT